MGKIGKLLKLLNGKILMSNYLEMLYFASIILKSFNDWYGS